MKPSILYESSDLPYIGTFYVVNISGPIALYLSKNGWHDKVVREKGWMSKLYRFKTHREAIQCFYKFSNVNDSLKIKKRTYTKCK